MEPKFEIVDKIICYPVSDICQPILTNHDHYLPDSIHSQQKFIYV